MSDLPAKPPLPTVKGVAGLPHIATLDEALQTVLALCLSPEGARRVRAAFAGDAVAVEWKIRVTLREDRTMRVKATYVESSTVHDIAFFNHLT